MPLPSAGVQPLSRAGRDWMAALERGAKLPGTVGAMKLAIAVPVALALCAACDERSDLEKCAADTNCAAAMEAVDNAQATVNTVCPKDENKTNEACDSAMNALDSAEQLQSQLQPK